jgi:hypothetical protein
MGKKRGWLPLLALSVLAGLLLFQAWAYYYQLPLSLGPRVILQPWLLQNQFIAYEQIVDQHTPLMPMLIASLRFLFPDGLQLAKLVLVALISLVTLLTFLAGRHTAGWLGGLLAALFFVAWSPEFGFAKLWHETFLAPLYLLLLLLYNPSAPRRSLKLLLCLGIIGGSAVLIKQHAAVVFAAFLFWNALTSWHVHRAKREIARETGLMILGAALPISALAVYQYAQAGTLRSFWYWAITYNLTSDYRTLAALVPNVTKTRVIAWSCFLLPAAIFRLIDEKRRGNRMWLGLGWGLVLLATSSLTAYPRFGMFHLQAALPVLAWLSAVTLAAALQARGSNRSFVVGIALALSAFSLIIAAAAYQPVLNADRARKIWEYSDLVPLADEIRQEIGPTDCIYLFPDDEATANLYYLSGCFPPKFWVFHYPWYVLPWVDHKAASTLEEDPPRWIVMFPGRWGAEQTAVEIMGYLQDHYQRQAELHWEGQGEVWLLQRQP